jgi:hypothetical protein
MSELRDRIAAVLRQELFGNGGDGDVEPEDLADAVIAELGLTRVTRSERIPKHRYVTDWKAATTPPGYWYDKDGTKADDE